LPIKQLVRTGRTRSVVDIVCHSRSAEVTFGRGPSLMSRGPIDRHSFRIAFLWCKVEQLALQKAQSQNQNPVELSLLAPCGCLIGGNCLQEHGQANLHLRARDSIYRNPMVSEPAAQPCFDAVTRSLALPWRSANCSSLTHLRMPAFPFQFRIPRQSEPIPLLELAGTCHFRYASD
jgi:hypothetical protein